MRAQQRGNHYLQRQPLSFQEVVNQQNDEFEEVIEPMASTPDENVIDGGNIIYRSAMRPVKRGSGFSRRNTSGQQGDGLLKQKLKNAREMTGLGLLNFDNSKKVKDTVHKNIKLLL